MEKIVLIVFIIIEMFFIAISESNKYKYREEQEYFLSGMYEASSAAQKCIMITTMLLAIFSQMTITIH